MSYVADIILVTAIEDGGSEDEHQHADQLSRWLQERHNSMCQLRKVDQYAGGDKSVQCDVFMAAVNYAAINDFVEAFRSIPWDSPECAQLMIKNENDDVFTIYSAQTV